MIAQRVYQDRRCGLSYCPYETGSLAAAFVGCSLKLFVVQWEVSSGRTQEFEWCRNTNPNMLIFTRANSTSLWSFFNRSYSMLRRTWAGSDNISCLTYIYVTCCVSRIWDSCSATAAVCSANSKMVILFFVTGAIFLRTMTWRSLWRNQKLILRLKYLMRQLPKVESNMATVSVGAVTNHSWLY